MIFEGLKSCVRFLFMLLVVIKNAKLGLNVQGRPNNSCVDDFALHLVMESKKAFLNWIARYRQSKTFFQKIINSNRFLQIETGRR